MTFAVFLCKGACVYGSIEVDIWVLVPNGPYSESGIGVKSQEITVDMAASQLSCGQDRQRVGGQAVPSGVQND